MKNIHLLPTEKPSRLFKFANQLHLDNIPKDYYKKYNIYITSDEEIKEDEYYLTWQDYYNPPKYVIYVKSSGVNGDGKKIILTTDPELIADGVQEIDYEFLEWFVKNPSCEEVEVLYDPKNFLDTKQGWEYTIIIPKEEPKQDEYTPQDFINEISWNKSKQETLEEVAANLADPNICKTDNWISGAEWQAERMYSEKEVYDILFKHTEYFLGSGERMSLTSWFEQFKKK